MKLLNRVTAYFAALLLVIMTVWAGLFYMNMLDEIYDSMDDGLENQKILVMQQAAQDSTVLNRTEFEDGYYKLREVPASKAFQQKDIYQDTLMYMLNEEDFEPVRMLTTVFQRGNKFYELRVITSMVEEDDLIEDLFFALLWLYLGLVATILVLNNLLLKKIWKPFYLLLHRLQRFRLQDSTPFPTPPTNIEEFKLLNQTVEKLLRSNIETYTSQKNFIENASHELQTPLAISLNKLELLAEGGDLQDRQLEQIGSVMQNLERLSRLNKSLLLLSKIENKQFGAKEEVNLKEIIQKAADDFQDQIQFRNLTVDLRFTDVPQVSMNPDLAVMLVVNLLKNAVVHNTPGGFIQVYLSQTELRIENSGKDTGLNEQQLFQRFYKESPTSNSTGLGLSITKAICDLYGFKISYHFEQKHVLTVQF